MSIQYSAIDKPETWLELMAQQFGVSIVDDKIELPCELGEGFFRQYYPFEWLTVSYLHFKVHQPMAVERKGIKGRPLIPIVFYLDDNSEQFINNKQYSVGINNNNGIFMPSPEIDTQWVFPANKWITNLTLTLNREWLIKELTGTNSYIYNLLTNKNPYYIFESFSPSLLCIIQQIERNIDSVHELNRLFLYESILRLFNAFLSKANERLLPDVKSRIHAADVSRLFHVREIVLDNLCNPPSMSILSKEAGMSVSKLQKCFKLVFGKSIIQYAIEEKMKYAKNLLTSKEYSVSEVGYRVGYSNLSHFSEAFHKMFHMTPKTYLSSIQNIQDGCVCCYLNRDEKTNTF